MGEEADPRPMNRFDPGGGGSGGSVGSGGIGQGGEPPAFGEGAEVLARGTPAMKRFTLALGQYRDAARLMDALHGALVKAGQGQITPQMIQEHPLGQLYNETAGKLLKSYSVIEHFYHSVRQ